MEQDSTKALGKVIRIDEGEVRGHLTKMVRGTVEETLNALLDEEADRMCRAQRYERSPERIDTRAGHYSRKLHTQAGEVELKVPKLRRQTFETAIIERYRRRDISIEEAIVQMYLAGVSVRRVEDITEALWGTRVSSGTVSNLNRKVFSHVPRRKVRQVAAMLKAIHAQESRPAALVKAQDVIEKLKAMKLAAAAELVENVIEETLAYYSFPSQHWIKLKTNNPMERLLREARRRTKVVGAFPDGQSALMLVAARLRHVSTTQWGLRKYMNVGLLTEMDKEVTYAAA